MAFLQDNRSSREPFLNAPATILWLMGLLLATHALRVFLPDGWPNAIIENYALVPAKFAEAIAQGMPQRLLGLAITLISYMLLHGDIAHVGLNSLWLLVFGSIVVRRLGAVRFIAFFVFCGIAAAIVHLSIYWGSPMAVVGASGGISGLMAGGMRILYGRFYGDHALAPIFSRPILGFSAVWVIVNIISGVLRLGIMDDLTLIAWVAHLGGFFAGLIMIGAFDRPLGHSR